VFPVCDVNVVLEAAPRAVKASKEVVDPVPPLLIGRVPARFPRVKLASTTSISTSELVVSSVTDILLDAALSFLNSKLTPVFCLNTPTPPVPTLDAVFISPDPPPLEIIVSMNYPQLAPPELWVSTSLSSFLAKLSVDF
jgi:hypothetical protein